MSQPPAEPDRLEVERFWERAIAAGAVQAASSTPTDVGPFGDSAEIADELISLIASGVKRATAYALCDPPSDDEATAPVGELSIATDGSGRPRAVLRTTERRVGPFSSVDDAFAWDEGEGDRSRQYWLEEHERFFRNQSGITFDPAMTVAFERFELLYLE